jgi:hypothetical protein
MSRRGTWGRIAAVVGPALALVLIAAAVAVAFDPGHWGCKSQAELERRRLPTEVVAAFADAGVQLAPTRLPRAVVGADRAYRGGTADRYDSERATLWVFVCRARCAGAPPRLVSWPTAGTCGSFRRSGTTSQSSGPTTTAAQAANSRLVSSTS